MRGSESIIAISG